MKAAINRTMMCLGVLLLGSASRCYAGTITYNVSLNTSPLIGHAAAPFSVNVQLNDGSGTNDANNTITLSNFVFGAGGSAFGAPSFAGGATGSLGAGIHLIDSGFLNAFTQGFTPGSQLSFLLQLTNSVDAGGTPDEFSFAILDGSGFEIPTLNFANALIVIDINSPSPAVQTFATDPTTSPFGGGSPIEMGPAQITSTVPEPSSLVLLSGGFAILWMVSRRFAFNRCQ